jgi:hypothetical protein
LVCLVLLQTQEGHPAQSMTAQEFADCMEAVKTKAELFKSQHAALFAEDAEFVYSYDNAKIHTSAEKSGLLAEKGITESNSWALPTYSPDIHKVIEHVFGRLKPKFQEWLNCQTQYYHVAVYKAKVMQILAEVTPANQIEADVRSLVKNTMPKIVECDGDHIPKRFR